MIELGELESHFQEFKNRKTPVEIVAISTDNREDGEKTQKQFPHLKVVADTDQKMCQTLKVMHGEDKAAPTTILVDGQGKVRWLFRPDRFLDRLSPAQLLAAIDQHMPEGGAAAP
jgi:peroxiredoxin